MCQALGEKKIEANKKVPGLFKDECNSTIIIEFIGLCPKMYSVLKVGNVTDNSKHEIRKAKGVPSKIVKTEFHHERYNKALFDPNHKNKVTFCTIRSDKHNIHMIEVTKIGLSLMDDKNGS